MIASVAYFVRFSWCMHNFSFDSMKNTAEWQV